MTLAAVLVVALAILAVLFIVARLLFGSALAVLLCGGVGWCFGGPPGCGAGIVAGLVLAPITWMLFWEER
jgi:hypothetical protein